MGFGEVEDGEAFGDVFFGPSGEFGLFLLPFFNEGVEAFLGLGSGFCVEDGGDVVGDGLFEFLFGDEVLGVLLEVELAALPGGGVAGGAEGRSQSGMGVGGDEVGDSDAALFEVGEELAPVDFGFGEGAVDTEDHAFAVVAADADGFESGAVADSAVDADFVVGGVEDEVFYLGKRAGAPFGEFFVELFVEVGYLAGGDFEAAEGFHDFGDAAGGDALDVEGGDGGFESAVAAAAFFEEACSEGSVAIADLGDGELEGAEGGLVGSGFEAVGIAVAFGVTLVGGGTDVVFAFEEHGGVHEDLGDGYKSLAEAFGEKGVDELVVECSVILVVHGCCLSSFHLQTNGLERLLQLP